MKELLNIFYDAGFQLTLTNNKIIVTGVNFPDNNSVVFLFSSELQLTNIKIQKNEKS